MANLRSRWDGLSLVQQFALMASVVVGSGMLVLGSFVSAEIESNVVHNAATATALYVTSLHGPHLQELTTGSALSEESLRALDASFMRTALDRQIISVKIWRPDGRIVYSTRRFLMGQTFSINPRLLRALKGEVAAQFGSPADEDDADTAERRLDVPLLEIYVPIRAADGDRIVAAGEFFIHAGALKAGIDTARLHSWIAVGGVAVMQVILLYGIVWRGNRTIQSQRAVLVDARRASVETSERLLRRVGSDLHDGPAQLIGLALLRLDTLRPDLAAEHPKSEEFEQIRTVLQDCLREIRHLAAGLAPPHLDNLPLDKVLELAVRQHEQRTSTAVNAEIGTLPANISSLHKVSIYRFVQEGLNNAYRHAASIGQTVRAVSDGDELIVEVEDEGPGFSPSSDGGRLGLPGLRDRIESLGGRFSVETQLGLGTKLRASFQVADAAANDV
jgi:signal transduction histidine kinase